MKVLTCHKCRECSYDYAYKWVPKFRNKQNDQQYGDLGICWKLSPEVGEGTYWTYGQKDLDGATEVLGNTLMFCLVLLSGLMTVCECPPMTTTWI